MQIIVFFCFTSSSPLQFAALLQHGASNELSKTYRDSGESVTVLLHCPCPGGYMGSLAASETRVIPGWTIGSDLALGFRDFSSIHTIELRIAYLMARAPA